MKTLLRMGWVSWIWPVLYFVPQAWQPQITGPSRRLILDDVNLRAVESRLANIAQYVHYFYFGVLETAATLQMPIHCCND